MRTCMVVLPMHRSGSSALTYTLKLLGFELPKTLVARSKNDNDLGFWESQPVVDLNDEFLKAIGSHWYDFAPPRLDLVPKELTQDFIARAGQLIEDEFGNAQRFVMKDPRISLLFPLWHKALTKKKIKVLCVLPIRNPLDVAGSLYKRNRILQGESLLSWLRFVLDAERSTRGCSRVFVHYNDLLADWGQSVARIGQSLDMTWPDSPTAAQEIDAFLSEKWRHHHAEDEAVLNDPAISPWVKQTYGILRAWCQDTVAKGDQSTLGEIARGFDGSAPSYRTLVSESRDLSVQARELERKTFQSEEKMLQSEEKMLVHRNAEAAALSRAEESETRLTEVQAELASTQTELSSIQTQLAEASTYAQERVRQITDDYHSRLSALEAEKAALEQQAQKQRAAVNEARQALNEMTVEVSTRLETYAGQARDATRTAREATAKLKQFQAERNARPSAALRRRGPSSRGKA